MQIQIKPIYGNRKLIIYYHNTKFSGKTIKECFPEYDMTLLSTTIPLFKNSFESRREFELFIIIHYQLYMINSKMYVLNKCARIYRND